MPSSRAPTTSATLGEKHDARRADRSRIEVDQAERALIEQAAAQLRRGAIRAAYAGLEHKHLAFALALMLDELALHLRDLNAELRAQVLAGARSLLVTDRSAGRWP